MILYKREMAKHYKLIKWGTVYNKNVKLEDYIDLINVSYFDEKLTHFESKIIDNEFKMDC